MSNDGPTFKMLESMMTAIAGKNGEKGTYDALSKLLKSGIPGMEQLFDGKKGFSKMSDEDKARFLAAVTGSDGKVRRVVPKFKANQKPPIFRSMAWQLLP